MLLNGTKSSSRPERAVPIDLRLRAIAENVPASDIDEVWVFPPLPNRDFACEFIVLLCYDGGEDRRRIVTSHVDAQFRDPESEEFEWVQRVREHGTAPQRWIAEMPDRLLGRLAESGTPAVFRVGGRDDALEETFQACAKSGNGNGNGNGHSVLDPNSAIGIDSRAEPVVTFSTIIEFSDAGEHTEPSE